MARVARRMPGGATASRRRAARRSRAATRFCRWERCSAALMVSTVPEILGASRSSTRVRWMSFNAVVVLTSRWSCTRESAVLTLWPPGPEERENCSTSSRAGTLRPWGAPGPGGTRTSSMHISLPQAVWLGPGAVGLHRTKRRGGDSGGMGRTDNASLVDLLPGREGDIVVRRLSHGDADAFAAGTKDRAVSRYGHLPLREYSPEIVREQIDGVISQGLADGSLAVLAIADAVSDEFLGSIVLFDVRADRAEVGFWLAPAARGRGAARHGLRAVTRLAGGAGLAYLDARTDAANDGSRQVLEGVGFIQTGGPHPETAPSGEVVRVLTFEHCLIQARTEISSLSVNPGVNDSLSPLQNLPGSK